MHRHKFEVIDTDYHCHAIVWSCTEELKNGIMKSDRQVRVMTRDAYPIDANYLKVALNRVKHLVALDRLVSTKQDCKKNRTGPVHSLC